MKLSEFMEKLEDIYFEQGDIEVASHCDDLGMYCLVKKKNDAIEYILVD